MKTRTPLACRGRSGGVFSRRVEVAIPRVATQPGDTRFMNVIRAMPSYDKHLAWSPTFQTGFLVSDRLGAANAGITGA
jgi:hypothetical protein